MIGTAEVIAFYVIVVAYSAAATLFFVELARPDGTHEAPRWGARALAVGVVLQLFLFLGGLLHGTVEPFSIKFGLALCACTLSLSFLALRRRMRIDAIGVVVAPLSLAMLVGAQFLRASGAVGHYPETLLVMHVASNVLGLGFFLLAGAAGAFYLVQERRLKEKRVGSLHGRLPALDALDSTEHRLLLAGFPLLTVGIVSGAIVATGFDLRAALAYATWILVAGVLVLRAVAGWRGRRAAYGTLAGVACVFLVILIYAVRSRGGGL